MPLLAAASLLRLKRRYQSFPQTLYHHTISMPGCVYNIRTSMSVLLIVEPKCTLVMLHAAPWWAIVSMPMGQMDGRLTITLWFSLDAARVINLSCWWWKITWSPHGSPSASVAGYAAMSHSLCHPDHPGTAASQQHSEWTRPHQQEQCTDHTQWPFGLVVKALLESSSPVSTETGDLLPVYNHGI